MDYPAPARAAVRRTISTESRPPLASPRPFAFRAWEDLPTVVFEGSPYAALPYQARRFATGERTWWEDGAGWVSTEVGAYFVLPGARDVRVRAGGERSVATGPLIIERGTHPLHERKVVCWTTAPGDRTWHVPTWPSGIPDADLARIITDVASAVPTERVIVFGECALGMNTPAPRLGLCVMTLPGAPAKRIALARVRAALAWIPYESNLVVAPKAGVERIAAQLPSVARTIMAEGVTVYDAVAPAYWWQPNLSHFAAALRAAYSTPPSDR